VRPLQSLPSRASCAQGFLTLVTLGFGMVIGNLINGLVTGHYKLSESVGTINYNWKMIWLIPAVMAAAVAILFLLFFKDRDDEASPLNDSEH